MSQDARMREVIDDAVAQATAPLETRLEELDARLRAVEKPGGPSAVPEQKRAATGRTAKGRTGEETPAGQ
jgi:hypothetical protein